MIWRTTVPGHTNCIGYKEPVNDLASMESKIRGPKNFHWGEFQHQNVLILDALEASGIEYQALDAYEINMRRPDGHVAKKDCLHSCLGSKQHVYDQIVLHYLRMRQKQELMVQ